MRKPRRNHTAAFKARVALEAIRGEKGGGRARGPPRGAPEPGRRRGRSQLLQNAASALFGGVLAADGKEQIQASCTPRSASSPMERDFLDSALGKFPGLSGKR